MKILGIDPGLHRVGFAVLEDKTLLDYGVITTDSGLPIEQRLVEIAENLNELLETYQPEIASIEELFFVQNVTNGIAVAQARGVMLLTCAQHGLQIVHAKPKQVKTAVCGFGNAGKTQIQAAVQQIFGLAQPPQPDDAADAIALAYYASNN